MSETTSLSSRHVVIYTTVFVIYTTVFVIYTTVFVIYTTVFVIYTTGFVQTQLICLQEINVAPNAYRTEDHLAVRTEKLPSK